MAFKILIMARVKLGAIITDIRGKVGGQNFANSLGGLTLKNSPSGFRGAREMSTKLKSSANSTGQQWGVLTDAQRNVWNVFATGPGGRYSKGENIYLRGYGVFIKYNYHYKKAYSTVLATPSFIRSATIPLSCTIELSGPGVLELKISRALDNTKEFLQLSLSSTKLPSRSIDKRALRHITYVTTGVASINISNAVLAVFGRLPAIGDTIYIAWKLLDKYGNYVQIESGFKTVVL